MIDDDEYRIRVHNQRDIGWRGPISFISILIVGSVIAYIYTGVGKEMKKPSRLARAIEAVQKSESISAGVPTLDMMKLVVAAEEAKGKYIKIGGWVASSCPDGVDVWFHVTENGQEFKFHWVLDDDGTLHPANDLAQGVSKQQKVTF